MKNRKWVSLLVALLGCFGLTGCLKAQPVPVLSPEEQTALWDKEGTVFRTGIMATGGRLGAGRISYAVSPDGTRILFSMVKPEEEGFWLLNLKNGHVSQIPGEAGHYWSVPRFSQDGKQVLAISTPYQNKSNPQWERKIILLHSTAWSYRKLAIPKGDNNSPSFSPDQKVVLFIKGTTQKNPTSDEAPALYDLYAYELTPRNVNVRRLTHEWARGGMNGGYDDGQEVFFSAKWLKRLPSRKPKEPDKHQIGIYALNKMSLSLRLLEIDQEDGFFDLLLGGVDKDGNLYFKASLEKLGGENSIRTAYRCDAKGQNCARLTQKIYPLGHVAVAHRTGEVFVDDRLGNEIVFRRLSPTIAKP